MSYKIVREFARNMRKHPTPAEAFFRDKVRGRKFLGLKFNPKIPHIKVSYYYKTSFDILIYKFWIWFK